MYMFCLGLAVAFVPSILAVSWLTWQASPGVSTLEAGQPQPVENYIVYD